MRLRSANRRKPIRVLRPSGPAATRSTPANISGLGMQPRGQQLPATLLSKSWSTSHIAHTSSTDRFTSQAGSAGFAASRGDQAVGQLLMPKTEEGMHQAPQLPAPGGQDQQQPGGELITDFSRALVESLHRDDEQQPQQQEEPLQAAAPDADADAEDEHPAMQDADSSPLAPARRGPRGTSSRYRGVTRHRRTKRWEAHIWDDKKQVYLGGFDVEEHAGKAHDVMALKCRGVGSPLNFGLGEYQDLLPMLPNLTKDEVVLLLRRQSKGFQRAANPLKGVRKPRQKRAAQLLEPCMGPQHQDPDYHPPIHPADMEDSDDENGDGPQTPSSAAGGDPGVFTGISARARLALAAAQSTGGPGALQALACGYSEGQGTEEEEQQAGRVERWLQHSQQELWSSPYSANYRLRGDQDLSQQHVRSMSPTEALQARSAALAPPSQLLHPAAWADTGGVHQGNDSLGLVYSPQLLPANGYSLSLYAGCLPYRLEAAPGSSLCFARDSGEGPQLQLQRSPGLSAFQPYSHQATLGSRASEQEAYQDTSAGMYSLAAAGVSMAPAYAYAGQAQLVSAATETTPKPEGDLTWHSGLPAVHSWSSGPESFPTGAAQHLGGLSSPTLLQAGVHHFPSLLLPEHTQDSLAAQSGAFLLSSPSASAVVGGGLAAPAGYASFGDQGAAQPQ